MEEQVQPVEPKISDRTRKIIIASVAVVVLVAFYLLVRNLNPETLKTLGYTIPLPLFTGLIALVDSLNPCTFWILTFMLVLMMSVSQSRKKILTIGYTFIGIVFLIYFLVMSAWLNIFLYLGYYQIITYIVAAIAIIAGLINCKEFFFYRKGVTLMVQDSHMSFLKQKIEKMKNLIRQGTTLALIGYAIILALFSSLVEIPCTAGFPMIYTKILTEKALPTLLYYGYIFLYNIIYILPLIIIVSLFGWFMQGKVIPKTWMKTIKLVSGVMMILLGVILLVNPSLLAFS